MLILLLLLLLLLFRLFLFIHLSPLSLWRIVGGARLGGSLGGARCGGFLKVVALADFWGAPVVGELWGCSCWRTSWDARFGGSLGMLALADLWGCSFWRFSSPSKVPFHQNHSCLIQGWLSYAYCLPMLKQRKAGRQIPIVGMLRTSGCFGMGWLGFAKRKQFIIGKTIAPSTCQSLRSSMDFVRTMPLPSPRTRTGQPED